MPETRVSSNNRRTATAGGATLLGALVLFAGAALAQPAAPPVDVAKPILEEVVDHEVYTGRFVAVKEVDLRARVSGYLDEVSFEDGEIVDEGKTLFTIDQTTFNIAVERSEANLAAAEAARDLARLEFERAQQLAQRNVGTAQDVDRTRATLAETGAQVLVAAAELRQVQQDLAFTEVRAPFRGRMSNRKVDPGNLIIGGASNSTLLSTIVSIDPIHFVFTASEADYLRYVRLSQSGQGKASGPPDTPVAVRLMDETDFVHKGTIDFVDNALNPNSGTITARAVLENPDGLLVPGAFGRMRIPVSAPYDALLIPDTAILSDQSRKIVMLVDGEGKVSPRPVRLGDLHRGLRVIREGLGPDDRVVVAGVQRARPGATVTPQEVQLSLEGN